MKSMTLTLISGLALLSVLAATVHGAARQATEGVIAVATSTENPVPLINQPLVPDAAKPGGAGFTLIINGTGFVSGSVVKWNGIARTTTFVSKSRLTSSILSSDIAKAGTAPVSVMNPTPGGGASNVVFFEVTPATPSIVLSAPVSFDTGSAPSHRVPAHSIAAGDFNRDGKLNLAVANNSSSNVSVLLGNGDGTFQAAVDYSTPNDAVSVAVGDFDGDGNPDLVVANLYTNVISVFLGNGEGTFQAAVNYSAGSNPNSVAVGDFNNDGRLDVAVADSNSTTVSILLQSPTVALSKTNLTFLSQLVRTSSASQAVALTNTSSILSLNIASIAVTGTNATDFVQTHTCGSSLRPGASCTINVTFKPTQIGPRTAVVTITDNAVASPQSMALSGTGLASGPNATLSPASLTFATQLVDVVSAAQPATLTNYGMAALAIHSITTTGDFSQSNSCGSSLATQASCTINVTFKPTVRGSRTGDLSITDNAAGSPQAMSLSGTGTVVKFNATSLNFGYVPHKQTKTLSTTLTDIDSTGLSITGITISGPYFSQTNNCGSSVGAGGSCTISVTFGPTGCSTPDSGAVSVSDNGGSSPQQVTLSGSTVSCK